MADSPTNLPLDQPHILIHHFTTDIAQYALDEIVKFNIDPNTYIEVYWDAEKERLMVRTSGAKPAIAIHPVVANVVGISMGRL